MNSNHTDLRDGVRSDLTVEFVTQRTLESSYETVQRLVVSTDDGKEHELLVTPARSPIGGLETGNQYDFHDIVGCAPIDTAGSAPAECPDCGDRLREGMTADAVNEAVAEASTSLDLTDVFGVVDEETTVTPVRDDDTNVDDWQPRPQNNQTQAVTAPDYVCDACGRHVSRRELRSHEDTTADEAEVMHSPAPTASADVASSETVGLAAGGAKDVTNFRENVESGYTPQPEAISDEGLFYDYYFETGAPTETDALFAPRYAAAVSEHPISGETERYLSVGLDSTLSVAEFERPRLDLVAVLDVSGSMNSEFDGYYYDEHGRKREAENDATTKLAAATQSLCALTEQLRDDDRLGVVLYNNRAHVAKPLRDVGSTDMDAIRRHIREVSAGGGTNLEDGFEAAWDMLADGEPREDLERRVVFMTDMMPNMGATGETELTDLFADAANRGIHTTFIGMGLDANAELADALTGIRGANYYFVHSAAEFEQRLGEEFAYMVTPLVYDLGLELETDECEIAAVHGSPSADDATGELMHVTTLFPSAKDDGEARGGVVLLRLDGGAGAVNVDLVASWTERDGSEHSQRVTVALPDGTESYDHDGVRKAVALSRYARELRSWAQNVHERAASTNGVDDWLLSDQRGEHERESVPLAVPEEYAARFEQLRSYLDNEMHAVSDDDMDQELALLDTLLEHGSNRNPDMNQETER
ncbi:Ca-activated chloride channel family protein [Halorientalis persicus]|uniref:Ca-activated chloride channel family protein n=1 Tax=Halorientalis persicus TaxID=1367881 RepID=A0A1H8UVB5_9EURY|nr:VWA domain-containing protein [Halorientalis persicus]SEP07152.1 Ca-activated chloride channel family protein [Halorientalis persicus]